MSRITLRLLLLLVCSTLGVGMAAAAPSTLSYQGNLADAGGQPITADLSITFRLYDSASASTALWTEVQSDVEVDGGNLFVELGSVEPLPTDIWGRQLYLGVQIAGDSEMLPRPALTATPYALRAAGTMKRTIVVSAEGAPTENGAALLAAVADITDASAISPVAVELDAGNFDLDGATLAMPPHTTLAGRGQSATLITSAISNADNGVTLQLGPDTTVRDLTARNTGVPVGNPAFSSVAIAANDPASPLQPTFNVILERVTGESIAPNGANGQRAGIRLCASNSRAIHITAIATGGQFASGLRAECGGIVNLRIDGATAQAADASDGVRGVWLVAGSGNQWQRLRITVDVPATVFNAFGIRVLAPGGFFTRLESRLSDSTITIRGSGLTTPTLAGRVEGIELGDSAQLAVIERVSIGIDSLRSRNVVGVRLFEGNNNVGATVELSDVDVRISALQEASLGVGEIVGIRAERLPPVLRRVRVDVDCVSGGFNPCIGIAQPENWAVFPGTLVIEDSSVNVGHRSPADGSTRSAALQVMGPTRVQNSILRATRSAAAEPVWAIRHLAPTAFTTVIGSTLMSTDAANSNSLCLFEGPSGAGGEWFGNHVQGARCDGGLVNLTCAGNTKRGTGLLVSTCP